MRASALAERHLPLPEQSFGHVNLSHADPSNMGWQLHLPVLLSHLPLPEHSALSWAVSVAVATSLHAGLK